MEMIPWESKRQVPSLYFLFFFFQNDFAMDEAVLESNHTFVTIKKTSCSTYIYAVLEGVRSPRRSYDGK